MSKDIRKNINLIESVIYESESVEIANYGVDQKDELQALITKNWPNVKYHGLDILDGPNSYYDQLDALVNAKRPKEFNYAQESYLGYDMDNDVFYSGYDGDPWEEPIDHDYGDDEDDEEYMGGPGEEAGSAVFKIKVIDGKLKILDYESHTPTIYMDVYNELHKRMPNLVDLRLD